MKLVKTLIELLKGGRNASGTERHPFGGDGDNYRIVYPFKAIRERAVLDIGDIRVLAAKCADERGRDFGQVPSDPILRESKVLILAAKNTGCFISAEDVPGSQYTIRTGESAIRMAQAEQVYYKIKNPFAKLHLKRHPAEYVLFEHVVQNILFPDCALEFLGIAEDCQEARIVYKQSAVRSDTRPDDVQIAKCLADIELKAVDRYSFGNDYVLVTDVGQDGDNVLVDDDGHLRFIDPIIGFKAPLLALLDETFADNANVETLIHALLGLRGAMP